MAGRKPQHVVLPPGAFRVQRLIRFLHADPAGIAYFPVYFDMFNALVEDWFTRALGIDYADMIVDRRLGLPIVRAECDFVAPSRMGDVITLGVVVQRVGRSSISIGIVGETGHELRLSGKLVIVTTSLMTFQAVPIPDRLRVALDAYGAACT